MSKVFGLIAIGIAILAYRNRRKADFDHENPTIELEKPKEEAIMPTNISNVGLEVNGKDVVLGVPHYDTSIPWDTLHPNSSSAPY